ncbi:hypothetical protein ACH4E7_40265 [Kitasatospora sp. NPDC018058]|uniref:hypothetical protein n=1 Tax=Kitasatospora sp. NPDC018058 TaxID=3364025 RepID=UPI0037BFC803
MGASASSRFQPCRDHSATEDALHACGVPYTSLRNGFYAASAVQFLGHALQSGQVTLPADRPEGVAAAAGAGGRSAKADSSSDCVLRSP